MHISIWSLERLKTFDENCPNVCYHHCLKMHHPELMKQNVYQAAFIFYSLMAFYMSPLYRKRKNYVTCFMTFMFVVHAWYVRFSCPFLI
jgi:hypothetical protein